MPKLARVEPECGPKMRCTLHTGCLMAVVAHCPEAEALLFMARSGFCGQVARARDKMGRTLLHVASSLGQRQLVEWLIRFRESPINGKDGESGYTALHRSLLFGQIHIAELLIELGANMSLVDYEGFTPADIVVHARPRAWDFSAKNPCDVFLWGSNSNFNLGIGHQQQRLLPEILEYFRRHKVFIREVIMQKFHTAFLASDGGVYTCGHGRGGRLGLASEEAQLHPRLVKALSQVEVTQVALGTDHSVFLNAKGAVYTCGTNEYHQLGHGTTSLDNTTPQLVSANTKVAKGHKYPSALGVAAARFHSVFWTSSSLYTWGLNAGQLGHLKGDKTIPHPKLVTSLNQKDLKIQTVVCTDGATVILTESGELIALHEYQTRRITVRQFNVSKIAVIGGHLDFKLSSQLLNDQTSKLVERGGEDLKVFLLYKTGKLAVWDESRGSQMFQCVFNMSMQLNVSDIAVSRNAIVFLTKEGLAYEGQHVPKKEKSPLSKEERALLTPLGQFRDKTLVYLVKVKRIPGMHRCAAIFSDPKGKNFAVLQGLPNEMFTEFPDIEPSTMRSNMKTFLDETSDMDALHDVTFEVKGVKFPAHRFILASVSDHLARQMSQSKELTLDGLEPYHFEQILQYAYTRSCDYLVPGPLKFQSGATFDTSKGQVVPGNGYSPKNPEQESAFSVHSKNKRDKKSPPKDNGHAQPISSPLQAFRDICKTLCIHGLVKALENMKFVQGEIQAKVPSKHRRSCPLPTFSRKSFPEFHDVCIKTDDGNELSAHRCVLSARSDYFRGMFSYNWVEAKEGQVLTLPVSSKVLPIILEFLYRDEASQISASEDPELVCNTLVVADQLLMGRLVNLCESHLCTLFSLRNIAEIFQFALDYNAVNLERGAMQFICQNLLSVLESRSLTGMVSIEGLEKLTTYYVRDYLGISRRKLSFDSLGPTPDEVSKFASSCAMTVDDLFEEEKALKMGKPVEKRLRRHSSGDKKPVGRNRTVSNSSFGSNHSIGASDQESKDVPDDVSDLSLDDLELQERLDINSNINGASLTPPASSEVPLHQQTSLSTFFIEPKDNKDKVFNKKFVKKSQKERKKELESASHQPPTTPPNVSTKLPWGGWAPVVEPTPEVSVLSDVFRQSPKFATPKEVRSTPKERRPRKQSWKQLSLTDDPSPVKSPPLQNPWKTLPLSPPTSDPMPTCSDVTDGGFKEILNFEVKQNESLFRATSKPLSVTQKEEKAIEELRAFYGAEQIFDERISVVRVDQAPLATPIWKRK
ncbi:inhibitor of Bruton tyrosine kinase-like [Tigriopus californicus]|uniref:inhibitor of Bruton tyrosine kinase-like n=1 Tax=Tigriopus californicus TaxID=6832 RepID=UPI0027DA363A|nr:inhibitor of Bruton tyrosine kinase-like [Tigriopus californicus]|eukprot:TCALIF_07452-PA protein Name:"Similar to ibtk Inhibitor of Bruton tyrosine kinase (Xenopus laevis)" AED:0.21 eAED:0.21 QI:0/-1/0/1/-1/1/1/0/1261